MAVLVRPDSLTAQTVTLSTNSGLAQVEWSSEYPSQPVSVTPNAPGPALPLDLSQIANAASVTQQLGMTSSASQALVRNGFVVIPDGRTLNMTDPYSDLNLRGIPPFVTSDSMLHLYHIQFDEILKGIETNQLLPQLTQMSSLLLASATNEYAALTGDLQEAARRNMAFFSVALELLGQPVNVPATVADIVNGEVANIQAHAGFAQSPLFNYQVDYSQFIPRGHYTASPDLERYFQAMMWYGQMAYLLKGGQVPANALVSVAEARIQTLAAFLMTLDLDQNPTCAAAWNRIYGVTAFFVGLADDLTPYDYKVALMQVLGAQVNVQSLTDDATFLALRKALAALPNPQIYGGTGNAILPPNATAADLDAVLNQTKGMRPMGQRFVPDSYMLQQLVWPNVGNYLGSGDPFTLVQSQGGPIRGFPRGLDVMVVLGSPRALSLLDSAGDTDYADYAQQINQLRGVFDSFSQADWTRNLYWSWLYALRPLLVPCGSGYPAFMRTTAWQDKELNAALASWAELRHDTILYAKQSYTPVTTVEPTPPPTGYVEPVPEFFERLRALTDLTRTGLTHLNVLDAAATNRLGQLTLVLTRLRDIAAAELEGQALSEDDLGFLIGFHNTMSAFTNSDPDSPTQGTALVADVHTDSNTGQVLEEGVGYVKLLVAAVTLPQHGTFLAAGPVFSRYEFKWPMSDRLTDSAWTNLLAGASAPAEPGWTASFMDPVSLFPDSDAFATNTVSLMRPQVGADGVRLQWAAEPTHRYRALYSDDLAHWFLLQTPIQATNATAELIDPNSKPANYRFYLVKPVPGTVPQP